MCNLTEKREGVLVPFCVMEDKVRSKLKRLAAYIKYRFLMKSFISGCSEIWMKTHLTRNNIIAETNRVI